MDKWVHTYIGLICCIRGKLLDVTKKCLTFQQLLHIQQYQQRESLSEYVDDMKYLARILLKKNKNTKL
jgi:hypothetical protein